MRQKQIHVPLGEEKEKLAHQRHDVRALTRARHPDLHHRHIVCVQENLCVRPLPAPAMDSDHHGKQLQDIDMIRAEGGGPCHVKPLLTEHRTKPHAARVSSKPECRRGDGKNARPFQLGRNSTHHAMSAQAAVVRLMWCAKAGTIMDKSISRRRKMRPGRTTLHAKESTPISDSSSRLVHFCGVRHAGRQARSRASFSGGKRIS